jgi:hypothetical protein
MDSLGAAKDVLIQHEGRALVFFRVKNHLGEFVGKKFENEQLITLSRYLEYTSYGEALVAMNRSFIKNAPYDEDLRGYEGLGCMRIIRDHGCAVLSTVIVRCYDQSGEDRLSSPKIFIKRAKQIANGHGRVLREFHTEMNIKSKCLLVAKIAVYASMAIFLQWKPKSIKKQC